jgi:hypothetical protein
MKCHVTRKLARVTIALIWTFSALVMSPWALFYQLRLYSIGTALADDPSDSTTPLVDSDDAHLGNGYHGNDDEGGSSGYDHQPLFVCEQSWPSAQIERVYFLAAIFVTCYTIPLACITACYALIGRRVCNRNTLGTQGPAGASGQTVIQRSKVRVYNAT